MPIGLKHLLITVLPFTIGAFLMDAIGHSPFNPKALYLGLFKQEHYLNHNWFHSGEFLLVMWCFVLGLTIHFIYDYVY